MELCTDPHFLQVFYILKVTFKIVLTIVPIIFMIMIFKDIFMAVVNSKPDEELKGLIPKSIKRFIAAIIVFLLPGLFSFIFTDLVPSDTELSMCVENITLDKINEYKHNIILTLNKLVNTNDKRFNKYKTLRLIILGFLLFLYYLLLVL